MILVHCFGMTLRHFDGLWCVLRAPMAWPLFRWFSDEMEVMGIAPNIVYGKYQWYINGPDNNLCVPMDVPEISKCKEISRYLQRTWFRCETAYISGLPNWANKSAQTHWEAVTQTRWGRGNCIRTRAIVVTFCQGLSGSGSVVESFLCFFFLGAEIGWIPKRCFFHGIVYFL